MITIFDFETGGIRCFLSGESIFDNDSLLEFIKSN